MTARLGCGLEPETGLPRSCYIAILWRLRRAPGRALRTSRLAETARSRRSRITHAIERLEKADLVRRKAPKATCVAGWPCSRRQSFSRRNGPRRVYTCCVGEQVLGPLSAQQRAQLTAVGEALLARLDPEALPGASDKEGRTH
ncbi:hypothetical protein GCM10010377_68250 [Streptomyces viridiviolaceus]|nr:hypothetical protein GCM10010377_68250 [Streptomyces viridiviolaceus]